MPNSMWEKLKPWMMQAVLLVVIGVLAWFVIVPFLASIAAKMDDIQKLSVMRDHRQKQLERLPDLEKQHELILAREKELDIILTKDRLVEFIERLETLALEGGVEIEIASRDNTFLESKVTVIQKKEGDKAAPKADAVADAAKKAPVKESGIITELPLKKYLRLTLTVTGEYASIMQYLHKLETLPYALDIIAINIKAHLEEGKNVPNDAGINPFVVSGGSLSATSVAASLKSVDRLDAAFETVIYLRE